jgi:hypothetical protein
MWIIDEDVFVYLCKVLKHLGQLFELEDNITVMDHYIESGDHLPGTQKLLEIHVEPRLTTSKAKRDWAD